MALRILHVGKFFPPERGGMEIFLEHLITAQREQGIEAAALVHGDPQAGDPPWLTRVPVQFQLIYAPIAIGFRAALARAIKQHRPDVLHLHMPNNSVFWVLTLPQARALPWVVHWHSDVVVSRIKWSVAAAYALYRPFEHAVLDGAECIIATSEPYLDASEPLAHWRHKCAVVPIGFDTRGLPHAFASLEPASGAAPRWRPDTQLRLLSIGRLTYYKGFETLIQAVRALPGVELLIAGDGEREAALQALIRHTTAPGQQPAVRLLGNITESEKHALLSECHVFCLASRERTEAFGVVLLEAMVHARPCIVTDLPGSGMPWVVAKGGAGLRVPIEDVAGWRNAITRLQFDADLRRRLGRAGRKAVTRLFDIKESAGAINKRYRFINPSVGAPAQSRGVLVAIAARNNAATIGPLLLGIRAAGFADVVVVDNRSTDGTCHAAESAGATVLRPLIETTPWGGIQTALRYARANGHSGVVTLDGDGQHAPDRIALLLRHAPDADLVIGAGSQRASPRRRLAWRWFRRVGGFDLRDLTSGFRRYNRAAMELLAAREATLLDYQDLGVLLLLRQAGLSIAEMPAPASAGSARKPRASESWFSVARYMALTTLLCVARWSGKDRAGSRAHTHGS